MVAIMKMFILFLLIFYIYNIGTNYADMLLIKFQWNRPIAFFVKCTSVNMNIYINDKLKKNKVEYHM